MSSLARRTLSTTATVAGIAALGAGFAGQAFAADLPELPAAPELPVGAPALPDLAAPELAAPELPAAGLPELPDGVDIPGIITFESPNVSVENSDEAPEAPEIAPVDTNVAQDAGSDAFDVPTGSHEAAEVPSLPGAPEFNGEFASPLGTFPLGELPALPELPATPELPTELPTAVPTASHEAAPTAPELPFAAPELPALPTELPSTTGQDIDTTGDTTVPSTGDIVSQITALAG
jgi:hypothetical protein